MSILIIAAIALAVVLGYKTKINTGFFCIAFAYIIGCFMLGMKTKDLIAEWPTSTMFVILAVSLFYNFAAGNGTLEKNLTVKAHKFSKTAVEKIESAGGKAEVI